MIDTLQSLLDRAACRPPSAAALAVAAALGAAGVGCAYGVSDEDGVVGVVWVAVAFAAGFAASSAIHWRRVDRPLARSRRIAEHVESGNLSETFPHTGPEDLRILNRLLNTLLADFQEILLLFAHLSAEAIEVIDARDSGVTETASHDRTRWRTVRQTLAHMRGVVESFTFFGVQIRGKTITDAGIEDSLSPAGHLAGDHPASNGRETEFSNDRIRERDAHHE
jgi:HAMP domain-containing protein